jgi:hypothetical protein
MVKHPKKSAIVESPSEPPAGAAEIVPWHDAIAMVGRAIFGSEWSGEENADLYRNFVMEREDIWIVAYGEARAKLRQTKGQAAADAFKAGQFGHGVSRAAGNADLRRVLGAERYSEIGAKVISQIPGASAAERWNVARGWLVDCAASGKVSVGIRRGSLPTPTPVSRDFWNRDEALRSTMTGEVAEVSGVPSGMMVVRASDIGRTLQKEGSPGHVMNGAEKAKLLSGIRLFLETISEQLGDNPPQAIRPKFEKLIKDAGTAVGRDIPRDMLRDVLRDEFPNLKRDRGRSGEV